MDLKIRGVLEGSNIKDEQIIIDVVEDTDIGEYILLDTTYSPDGKISNKVRHSYWFPDVDVVKGDEIILYTKKGIDVSENLVVKTKHYFYWGLKTSVWNDNGDCAVLLHSDEWSSKRVK